MGGPRSVLLRSEASERQASRVTFTPDDLKPRPSRQTTTVQIKIINVLNCDPWLSCKQLAQDVFGISSGRVRFGTEQRPLTLRICCLSRFGLHLPLMTQAWASSSALHWLISIRGCHHLCSLFGSKPKSSLKRQTADTSPQLYKLTEGGA